MPGIYRADRGAPPGAAGLTLPFTLTQGPVPFTRDASRFRNVRMGEYFSGQAAVLTGNGVLTHSIQECAVFAAAEWVNSSWGRVYFAHVTGGRWDNDQASAKWLRLFCIKKDLTNYHSVIVVPRTMGYRSFAEYPEVLGFPPGNLSVYISNTAWNLGFAIEFQTAMAAFGELDTPEPSPHPATPYGVVNEVASFNTDQW